MKAIGVGAGLTATGGTAAARAGDAGAHPQTDDGEPGTSPDEPGTGTVHEVRTMIGGPPTNAERPADFYYQPTGLHVDPGDVVKFVFATPDHNVVGYHPAYGMRRRVPIGVEAFSSPLLGWVPSSIPGDMVDPPAEPTGEGSETGGGAGGDNGAEDEGDGELEGPVPDTWLHGFDTPGVYDLLCSPHEGFGMAMRVVVGDDPDAPFETSDPSALPEPRTGPVGLARVTLTDPALEPTSIVEAGTVEWQSLESVQSGSGSGAGGDGENGGEENGDGETDAENDDEAGEDNGNDD
ncbi:hypothetical protein ACFQFH_17910 [Halobaculum halobium]|uniref:Blue (type 1) copper domain-containing protein n=1 Tax=Halobaculum halobium TaxID=3032281 RepID=A0ABD5TF09_9EURY|nr:hypothetical protein [Halobaculum sp. SYNS20]